MNINHKTHLIAPLLVPLAMLTSGCSIHAAKVYLTSDNRFIPVGLGSTSSCRGVTNSPLLHFDSLYVHQLQVNHGIYMFYRFWPTGQVFYHFTNSVPPNVSDGDDFTGGQVGKFCINGDLIEIEMYSLHGDYWQFETLNGHFAANGGIILTDYQWQKNRSGEQPAMSMNSLYERHVVGPMTRLPDW